MGKTDGLSEYEKIRNARIAENNVRLQECGIMTIRNTLTSLVESSKSKKRKEKGTTDRNNGRDTEYVPTIASESDEEDDPTEGDILRKVTRSGSRQQVRYIPPRSMRKYSSVPKQGLGINNLSDCTVQVPRTELLNNEGLTNERQQETEGPCMRQNNKDHNQDHNHPNQDAHHKEPAMNQDDMLTDSEGERSIGRSEYADLENEQVDYESEHVDLDSHDLALDAILEEKTRGPTMLHRVHMRPLEKRKVIILNEFGQPVGPITEDEDTVAEFSRFLGTIARDYSYAPLVYPSWRNVPNKEKMWEYVQMKYIVPDEGQDWVLKTIGAAWRIHKCRFKKKHYYSYKDDKTRWQNRSKRVPEEDFIKLLATWKKKTEKVRCSRNREHRLSQRNMHTAGPKSFATIREEMKNANPNKEPPSLAELFERTRKRNEGKCYKQPFEDTAKMIDDMKNYTCPDDGSGPSDAFLGIMGKDYDGRLKLYGRGVCKKKLKKVDRTSYVVPGEVMESLKATIYEDMRKNMDSDISRIEDMRKIMDEEHSKKKEELENMKRDLLIEKENMTEQVMQKILEKLPLDVARQYLL